MELSQQELSAVGKELAAYLAGLVEQRKIDVPLLPDVASRVLAMSNDPGSDAAKLAQLIQSDQALAGHVMRIANSAAYTPNASMVSLQQAIARLGMHLITEIALVASINTKRFKAPGYEDHVADIWRHALFTALWGKEVARISKKNVEASFLCGLLHSIGKAAMLQAVFDFKSTKGIELDREEVLKIVESMHGDFGTVIVQKWEMPVVVQEAVQYHVDYRAAHSNADQACIVHAAAMLANVSSGINGDSEETSEQLSSVLESDVFSDLNLYQDELEQLKDQEEKVKSGVEAMRA